MPDLQNEMNRAVTDFVAQITELARRAAVDTLASAFGRSRSAPRISGGRVPGGKRSTRDIGELQEQFVAFVTKNPGLRIEQINKQLGSSTKQLALPIRKLIANGSIKSKGKKRSTTYYAK